MKRLRGIKGYGLVEMAFALAVLLIGVGVLLTLVD